MADKRRVNVAIPFEAKVAWENAQERTGAVNATECLRRALTVYDALTEAMIERKETVWLEGRNGERTKLLIV